MRNGSALQDGSRKGAAPEAAQTCGSSTRDNNMRKTQEGGKQHKSITVKYLARLRMQLVHTGSASKAYCTIMQQPALRNMHARRELTAGHLSDLGEELCVQQTLLFY